MYFFRKLNHISIIMVAVSFEILRSKLHWPRRTIKKSSVVVRSVASEAVNFKTAVRTLLSHYTDNTQVSPHCGKDFRYVGVLSHLRSRQSRIVELLEIQDRSSFQTQIGKNSPQI